MPRDWSEVAKKTLPPGPDPITTSTDSANSAVLKEACGVFGAYSLTRDVARLTFDGLYALQHRGQESAGIATSDGSNIHVRTGMGLVAQVFEEGDIRNLPGHIAIGHTRYSTTGSSRLLNAQPILRWSSGPDRQWPHGNIVNAAGLRASLRRAGGNFVSSTDSEVIARLINNAPGVELGRPARCAVPRIEGAYSLVLSTPDLLMAVRDPMGKSAPRSGTEWVTIGSSIRDMRSGSHWR